MTKTQGKSRKTEPQDASQDLKKIPSNGHDADPTPCADLSNLRHELGTLLNAIIGYSEMLLEEAEDEGKKVYISALVEIHTAGKQLLAFVDEIFQIARLPKSMLLGKTTTWKPLGLCSATSCALR